MQFTIYVVYIYIYRGLFYTIYLSNDISSILNLMYLRLTDYYIPAMNLPRSYAAYDENIRVITYYATHGVISLIK